MADWGKGHWVWHATEIPLHTANLKAPLLRTPPGIRLPCPASAHSKQTLPTEAASCGIAAMHKAGPPAVALPMWALQTLASPEKVTGEAAMVGTRCAAIRVGTWAEAMCYAANQRWGAAAQCVPHWVAEWQCGWRWDGAWYASPAALATERW